MFYSKMAIVMLMLSPTMAFAQLGGGGSIGGGSLKDAQNSHDDSKKVIVVDREAFTNFEGKAELKQLSVELLKLCSPEVKDISEMAKAVHGVTCFERELAAYLPTIQTSKRSVKLDDGLTTEATVLERVVAGPQKQIPQAALHIIYYEASTCAQIARYTSEELKEASQIRGRISKILAGDTTSLDAPVDESKLVPGVIQGFNCYVNFFAAYAN